MNWNSLSPAEVYENSEDRYELIGDQILCLYKEYKHKDKISTLLEFWLWNIRIVFLVYGESGLKEFMNSDIRNPSRFAILKEANSYNNPLVKIKDNWCLFNLLNLISRNLFFQGAYLNSYLRKILGRISELFLRSMPIKEDHKLKKRIINLLMDNLSDININGLEDLLNKKLPFIFFTKQINFSVITQGINLECAAACFLEFNGYENIFLLNKEIKVTGLQHGGGYDAQTLDYHVTYEKSLCEEFIGWGLSEFNQKQHRFKKLSFRKDDCLHEKRIIWIEDSYLPTFYYMIQPDNHHQSKNIESALYIFKELKSLGVKYYNLDHPTLPSKKYEKYRDELIVRDSNKGESLFSHRDIGIFDNSSATLIHFFVENEMPFIVIIDRSDIDRYTFKQKEWFKVLYNGELAFFNDQVGRMNLSLSKIIKENYSLPREVVDYHRKIFRT